eukprot:m.71110 g.71110  ORF g.71110 m.71110 type:complete len:401 (+) comp50162_c0_seq7:101-1303(+)
MPGHVVRTQSQPGLTRLPGPPRAPIHRSASSTDNPHKPVRLKSVSELAIPESLSSSSNGHSAPAPTASRYMIPTTRSTAPSTAYASAPPSSITPSSSSLTHTASFSSALPPRPIRRASSYAPSDSFAISPRLQELSKPKPSTADSDAIKRVSPKQTRLERPMSLAFPSAPRTPPQKRPSKVQSAQQELSTSLPPTLSQWPGKTVQQPSPSPTFGPSALLPPKAPQRKPPPAVPPKRKPSHTTAAQSTALVNVTALFSNQSDYAFELAFEQGDVIAVLSPVDRNWLFGRLQDSVGLVPSAFVSVPSANSIPARRFFRGRYPFQGEAPAELAFARDDIMLFLNEERSDWLRVQLGRCAGWVPCTHVVEVFVDPNTSAINEDSKQRPVSSDALQPDTSERTHV